jgi:hypothetical protein
MRFAAGTTPSSHATLGEQVAGIQDAMSYLDAVADAPGEVSPDVMSRLDRVRLSAWEVVRDVQQRRTASPLRATPALRDRVP